MSAAARREDLGLGGRHELQRAVVKQTGTATGGDGAEPCAVSIFPTLRGMEQDTLFPAGGGAGPGRLRSLVLNSQAFQHKLQHLPAVPQAFWGDAVAKVVCEGTLQRLS